jgi:hypothetical protein
LSEDDYRKEFIKNYPEKLKGNNNWYLIINQN